MFSQAKIIMRPHWKSMKPWRLELLLFLRMNKHLWDVHDVHACLKREDEDAAAVAEVHDNNGGGATSSPSSSAPSLSSASISSRSSSNWLRV